MTDMHSKYNYIHKNGMFYALIDINICIIIHTNCMISRAYDTIDVS